MATDKVDYVGGLDLGQAADFTALVILERVTQQDRRSYEKQVPRRYSVRWLERMDLATPYPVVVDKVCSLYARAPLAGTALAIDQTGVGRAVVDMFVKARPSARLCPITITGGNAATPSGDGGWHVPKKELVSVLQALLQTKRLKVAKALPESSVLIAELENFRSKISVSIHETYEAWRAGDHDDLVLATGMACWLAEMGSQEFWMK